MFSVISLSFSFFYICHFEFEVVENGQKIMDLKGIAYHGHCLSLRSRWIVQRKLRGNVLCEPKRSKSDSVASHLLGSRCLNLESPHRYNLREEVWCLWFREHI